MEVTTSERHASGGEAPELPAQNLVKAFNAQADRLGDDLAIRDEAREKELTWNELRDTVHRIAGGLAKLGVEPVEAKVQDVAPSLFETLERGDVLFVDSSHVAKTGSDVNHLVFEILPRLKPGVRIHIHDVFLPAEYPKDWVIGENRSYGPVPPVGAHTQSILKQTGKS